MATNLTPTEDSASQKAINIIEINDLDSLKQLLLNKELNGEHYVHWQNGNNPQEAFLRIQNLNGKKTVCHYDIDGRTIIMPMREMIEATLGTKVIDVSGLERVGAGLFNPGGFAADQPIITDKNEKRVHAQSTLQNLPLSLLETMTAKTAASSTAANFAKGGKAFGFFNKKPKTTEVAPDPTNVPITPRMGGKGSE
ncbi:MAG: hypothetical protein P4M14_12665 [Gammaproteobacteria bacterium]|nr:hypothetical protein [Gammaproteobacteria bacterium]